MTPEDLRVVVIAIPILFLFFLAFRCSHAWEYVDKAELCSRLEEANKNGYSINSFSNLEIERMSRRFVIIVLRCSKCGKAKIFKESN